MSQTKHTSTPWRTEFHPSQHGEPATLIMQVEAEMHEKFIAECPWGKDGETYEADGDGKRDCTAEEAQANAAFIVRACNAHDALIAAMEAMMETQDCTTECWCDSCGKDADLCEACACRAALAAAKGAAQ